MWKKESFCPSTIGKPQNRLFSTFLFSGSIVKEWIEQDADQSSVDILLGGIGVSKIVAELRQKEDFKIPSLPINSLAQN